MWVGAGLRPAPPLSCSRYRDLAQDTPIPGSPASQVLCPVPDEGVRSVRKVGPPGPGPSRPWCLPTMGSVMATVKVAMPGCLFLQCLPSSMVCHGVSGSHGMGST